MKKIILFSLLSCWLLACQQDSETMTIDTRLPTGNFNSQRMGLFTEQNGTGTQGTASLGTDEDGRYFLSFSEDFQTNLATGTVTIFLSTSEMFQADPANGNPDLLLVGNVTSNGAGFYALDGPVPEQFTHVILWCASANIPFGYAPLQ